MLEKSTLKFIFKSNSQSGLDLYESVWLLEDLYKMALKGQWGMKALISLNDNSLKPPG